MNVKKVKPQFIGDILFKGINYERTPHYLNVKVVSIKCFHFLQKASFGCPEQNCPWPQQNPIIGF